MIFLDNASTTPLCDLALERLVRFSATNFFNPSASYSAGFENHKNIENVKKLVCKHLGIAFMDNIIFTGSATEATNLAVFGSYRPYWKKAVFSAGEHPSVFNCAQKLREMGVEVVFVDLAENGQVDLKKLENALDETVNFISVMHISNETGAINDMQKIFALKQQKCPGAILHCDGVQAFLKIPVDLNKFNPDFYTISAHKFHGPKGLGALFAKNKEKLQPIIYGGGQEYNLRSGTENVPAIMALSGALESAGDVATNLQNVEKTKQEFLRVFKKNIDPQIQFHTFCGGNFSPYILSISFANLKGQVLQNMCDECGLLISTGSACSSKKAGNRILENLGFSKNQIVGNVRISFSRLTSLQQAQDGAKILADCANKLWRNTR